jgi:hypothetical protein
MRCLGGLLAFRTGLLRPPGVKVNKEGKSDMAYERFSPQDNRIVLFSYPVFRSLFALTFWEGKATYFESLYITHKRLSSIKSMASVMSHNKSCQDVSRAYKTIVFLD